MKLTYQSYGSSVMLYICADSNKEAYSKYLSLFNWGATSTGNGNESWAFDEVEWVKDGVIAIWTTIESLRQYLFDINLTRILKEGASKFKGLEGGAKDAARAAADADFALIEKEAYRSINSNFDLAEFGTIDASKPDEDLKDLFIMRGFQTA